MRSMSRVFALVVAACVSLTASPRVHAADYALDGAHTSVVFAINHFGLSFCYGMFGGYTGSVSYDAANPTAAKFAFVIDANSLNTMNAKRDEHLKGPDFFNVKQFPEITFTSTSVAVDGTKVDVTGDLTFHGVTKPITLPLTLMGEGAGPDQKPRVGFSGNFKLKRSEFDMKAFLPNLGDDVTIMLSFEAIQQ